METTLKPGQLCMFDPQLARISVLNGWLNRRLGTPIDVFCDDALDVRFDLPFVFLRDLSLSNKWLARYVVLYTHAGLAVEERQFVVPFDEVGMMAIRRALIR